MRKIKAMTVMLMLAGVAIGATTTKPATPPVTWATTLPAIEISNQPLEKVLGELKQKLPGFDYTISRLNVPHDYPVLPAMTVENVSLGQFLQLLPQEIPGVQVTLSPDLSQGTNLFGTPPTNVPPSVTLNITPDPNAPTPVVRLFGLSEIIDSRMHSGEDPRQISNDILSLIQAALEESDPQHLPELKLHEPTKTLIFKGTPAQADIVTNALEALKPSDAALAEQNRSLKMQLEKLKDATTQSSK